MRNSFVNGSYSLKFRNELFQKLSCGRKLSSRQKNIFSRESAKVVPLLERNPKIEAHVRKAAGCRVISAFTVAQ